MARMHHIGITVSDTEAATEFYRTATGGEVTGPLVKSGPAIEAATGYPGVQILLTFIRLADGVCIELAEYRNADTPRLDPNNGFVGAAHPAIVVADIDAVLLQLAAIGYHTLSETMTGGAGPLEGYRYVYVLGPDAVRVELLQEPH